ncbi:hypothetical protein DU500_11405 [Haloplanus rubicundus]|uniref:Uncharacterized protein n=1 Tax=Haloplanus rubicundus TaxID=1547898 RepID=A0A345E460_9EURY|nr:hypothetical protein [Haloplanus rubicundus]AXG06982.1 hypothetical protein DU500_11405 [Haloplanus rubicundus]
MDREQLLQTLTSDVLTYVMHGSFPEKHVMKRIKPNGLDHRFDDFEMLMRLHFILRPDVVDFVEELPVRLRSIKTQTESVSSVSRGTVDGRIDWHGTIQERYSRNPRDSALFVCEHRSENYDIEENLVLKALLAIIYDTLQECRRYFQRDYEWVTDRWKDSLDLVETMTNLFERNVHVRRIRPPQEYEPTDRMIERSADSRQGIYRDAAKLLGRYRETLAGDADALSELLEQTAITPSDDETLFELYVLFRYVSVIENLSDEEFTMRTIESGSQEVARLTSDDTDEQVVLYHDNSARDRGLSFMSDIFDKSARNLSRTERIRREAQEIANTYFSDSEFRTATGRPDVIVLEIHRENQFEYLITEIKYSDRPETIRSGIKETLEYLAFLRQDDELVHNEPSIFGSGWNGVLVVQDLPDTETAAIDDQRSIRILQASEVEDQLQTILQRIL